MAQKPFPRYKIILFNCVYLFISFSFIVGVLELYVRYRIYRKGDHLVEIDPGYYAELQKKNPIAAFPYPLYILDMKYGWRFTPNNQGTSKDLRAHPEPEYKTKVKINSSGFRSSQEYSAEDKGFKIAVLGDSFVQGLQVEEEETFVKVAERNLQAQDLPVKIYNFGVGGWGTVSEYRMFYDEVLKIHPQMVIVAFTNTDLTDNSPYYPHDYNFLFPRYTKTPAGGFNLSDFNFSPPEHRLITPPFSEKTIRDSLVYDAWANKFKFLEGTVQFLKVIPYLRYVLAPVKDYYFAFDIHRKQYPAALEESLWFTMSLLSELNQYCKNQKIDFFVLLIPALEQLDRKEWDRYVWTRRSFLDAEDFDLDRPQSLLTKEFEKNSIPYLDLLAAFKKARKERLYFSRDGHFNALGHRRTGEALTEHLLSTVDLTKKSAN